MIEEWKNINESYKGQKTLSVSKCLNYLQIPFDQESAAQRCFEKGFNDPNNKYFQMSKEDILKSWSDKALTSCKYGSLLDNYIGLNLNNKAEELENWKLDNSYDYDKRLKGLCDGFDQFYKNLLANTDYKYHSREEQLFITSKETGNTINGRFDCLFYSEKNDRYLLIDWKSSGSINKDNKWEKLLGPCFELDACNGNTYTIQTQFYKKALTETYNITTTDKIDTMVCQMSIEPDEFGKNYHIYAPFIEYNSLLLDQIIDFAYKKYNKEKENH